MGKMSNISKVKTCGTCKYQVACGELRGYKCVLHNEKVGIYNICDGHELQVGDRRVAYTKK